MHYVTLLGFVAGILTTVALFPQLTKTWKTKRTNDLSLPMYLMSTVGITLWIIYGFLINDIVIIVFNIVTFVVVFNILLLKLKHG